MPSIDIYAILASKPHNTHYLKRYWKFIQSCDKLNRTLSESVYTEKHHICPKANDLFPEYASFVEHPWNRILLTSRQHVIAHLILWKSYGKSQTIAFKYFFLQNSKLGDSYLPYREIPTCIESRYAAKVREECRKDREGFTTYKDSDNNRYFLHHSDPLIKELNLVGNNMGYSHSEEGKLRMSGDRVTTLYKDGRPEQVVKIKVRDSGYQEEYDRLISEGWTLDLSDEYRAEVESNRIETVKAVMESSIGYYYPDGTLYGRIKHDDPAIKPLGLVHLRSEKQMLQVRGNARKNAKDPNVQAKKSRAIQRLSWFYDPITLEKGRFETRPEGWLPGRSGTITNNGTTTWNDGVNNYMVKPGEEIEPHWSRGMAPQKKRTYDFSNGVERITLIAGVKPPDGYVRVSK
jgi:hypothetical protein